MKYLPIRGSTNLVKITTEDFPRLSERGWYVAKCNGKLYVRETARSKRYLHRVVAGAGRGVTVDHINHDTFDNRRENLRVCGHAENISNRSGANKNSKSGIRGVFWNKRTKRWHADIRVAGEKKYLGVFASADAGVAVIAARLKYFGEFAGAP